MASFGEEAGFDLHWQPQFAEVAKSGDMGWTWGRYQLLVEGKKLYSGKYINILQPEACLQQILRQEDRKALSSFPSPERT